MCLTLCSLLSLCDKAWVAFNQKLVTRMAGNPNERAYDEYIDEHLFYVCTALLKISNRAEVYLKQVGWWLEGRERGVMYHAYPNLFCPRDHTTVRQPV